MSWEFARRAFANVDRVIIVGDESKESDFDLGDLTRPGHVLLGKYRIERVLGAGGMGAVVLAMHLQLAA